MDKNASVTACYRAEGISKALDRSYYAHTDNVREYWLEDAEKNFAMLADLFGYTLTKREPASDLEPEIAQ